ncbi:hypothetical protein CVT24_010472 [Panaeolus cyanescens]|uniref:Uncharacterized protein n=1 Tax=Panaeolus cyanescens TaxID=181874 RepID=A0A409WAT9_9AGAR|nr:hypothetical protein CVT24_010472 [Panaeolus cyanescens]
MPLHFETVYLLLNRVSALWYRHLACISQRPAILPFLICAYLSLSVKHLALLSASGSGPYQRLCVRCIIVMISLTGYLLEIRRQAWLKGKGEKERPDNFILVSQQDLGHNWWADVTIFAIPNTDGPLPTPIQIQTTSPLLDQEDYILISKLDASQHNVCVQVASTTHNEQPIDIVQCSRSTLPTDYRMPGVYPYCDRLPSTGRSQGCWITEGERARHMKKQRNFAVANLILPPTFGYDQEPASDSFIGQTEAPILGPSDVDHEAPIPLSSFFSTPLDDSTRNRSHLPSDHDKQCIREMEIFRSQIQDARSLIGSNAPYFLKPPTINDIQIRISQLNGDALDSLCILDPHIHANSAIIGYQTTLAKTKAHAQKYIQHSWVEVRLQAELTVRCVEAQQKQLRDLLVEKWRLQRRALQNKGYFHTDRFFRTPAQQLPLAVLAVYLLFGTLHLLSHLSLDDCNFSLKCVGMALGILLATSTSIHAPSVSKSIHSDVRAVLDILDVHPRSQAYIFVKGRNLAQPAQRHYSRSGEIGRDSRMHPSANTITNH